MTFVSFRRCLILALLSIQNGDATEKFEGDGCNDIRGSAGVCTPITFCPQVHETLKKFEERPLLCSFNKSTPIVCCTPVQIPNRIQIDDADKNVVGELADKYCRKYSEFTYTWVPSQIIDRAGSLINTCRQKPPSSINEPYPQPQAREFPHMIAFAVGPRTDLKWVCSGALISDEFVMTTAKCAKQRGERSPVQWALAGDFNLYDEDDDSLTELVEVDQILTHEQFQMGNNRNDIALVKLQRKIALSRYVIPACLPMGQFSTDRALATGWHMNKNEGDLAKVAVNIVPESECRNVTGRKMRNRMRNSKEHKICAKPIFSSDYCQRNSGDPLQYYRPGIHCMYDIIGLTSEFGSLCESSTTYTDISSYISWIEQTVWGQYVGQSLPENDRIPLQTSTDISPNPTTTSTPRSTAVSWPRPTSIPAEYSTPISWPGSRPNSRPTPRPSLIHSSSTQNSTLNSFHNTHTQSGQDFSGQNSTQTNQEAALLAALRPQFQPNINNRFNGQNSTGQNVIPINGQNMQSADLNRGQENNTIIGQNSDNIGQESVQRNNTVYNRLTFN